MGSRSCVFCDFGNVIAFFDYHKAAAGDETRIRDAVISSGG